MTEGIRPHLPRTRPRDDEIEMRADMDKRFDSLTRRLDSFMLWSMGIYLTGIGAVMAILWRMMLRLP